MSPTISKYLDDNGTRFVNAQLLAGGILARAVVAARGPVIRALAPLPEELDPGPLTDFEHGGVTSLDRTIQWLALDFVKSSPEALPVSLVIEDSWFKPSDVTGLQNGPLLQLSEGDALVYSVNGDQLDEPVLRGLFKLVRGFCFGGFIVDGTNLQSRPVGSISASELAEHVKSIFVSAFDREGVIVGDWGPKRSGCP